MQHVAVDGSIRFDQASSQSICFFDRNNNNDLLDLWIGATDLRQ